MRYQRHDYLIYQMFLSTWLKLSNADIVNALCEKWISDSKLGKVITMLFHASITDAQSTSIKRGDKFSAFTSLIYFNQIYYMKRSLFIAIVEIKKHNLEKWSYFHWL